MRDAVRNKEKWKGRHTPTQDPSTNNPRAAPRGLRGRIVVIVGVFLDREQNNTPASERGAGCRLQKTHTALVHPCFGSKTYFKIYSFPGSRI